MYTTDPLKRRCIMRGRFVLFLVVAAPCVFTVCMAACPDEPTPVGCFAAAQTCMWDSSMGECYELPAACAARTTESTCQRVGTVKCVWSGTGCSAATVTPALDSCSAMSAQPSTCRNDTMCEFDAAVLGCVEERANTCHLQPAESACNLAHGCLWSGAACVAHSRDYTVVCASATDAACIGAPTACSFNATGSSGCAVLAEVDAQDVGLVHTCRWDPANPFMYDNTQSTDAECVARGACEPNTASSAPFACMPYRDHVCAWQPTAQACARYSPCEWVDADADGVFACAPAPLVPRSKNRNAVVWLVLAFGIFALAVVMLGVLYFEHDMKSLKTATD